MAKFNVPVTQETRRGRLTSPVMSVPVPGARTYEGAVATARDPKSELFLLGTTNFVSEGTFYEGKKERDARYTALVRQVAVQDPEWLAFFAHWLRVSGNMRSAPVVLAAEAVAARLASGSHGWSRKLVDAVLQRPDEPGEFLAYWESRWGTEFPMSVKRGVADAVTRMYTERAYTKYDSSTKGWRFSDVLTISHARPKASWQAALFEHIVNDRYGRAESIAEGLQLLRQRKELLALPVSDRRAVLATPDRLRVAGFTWEALSGWLQGPMDAQAWEAIIPSMNVMALIRNLRNFDQAEISDEVAQLVIAKITDQAEVVKSRTFPMRWLSAYNHVPSDRWKHALSIGASHTLSNVPKLGGRTLIMVDVSSSMDNTFSKDGTLQRWDAAAVFGIALGKANAPNATVSAFSSQQTYYGDPRGARTKTFELRKGANVLNELARWKSEGYFMGGGTETAMALRQLYDSHDRVVILTDEQASQAGYAEVGDALPAHVPLYTWNLAGYEYGHASSGTGNRHTFGGLTDAAFSTIAQLESMQAGRWPWEGSLS